MRTDHVIALVSAVRARSVDFLAGELKARGVLDLKPSHGALLASLFGRGGKASMRELLASGARKKSTLTEMANKLEKQGYLKRLPDPDDARGVVLELSDRAWSIRPAFDAVSEALLDRAWRGFSQRDRETLIRLLTRMLDSF